MSEVIATAGGGVRSHSLLQGLNTGDPHSQYLFLAGRSGGQTVYGGSGSGENLALHSTSHATKGQVQLAGSTMVVDGSTNLVGIGQTTPVAKLDIAGDKSFISWTTTGRMLAIEANTLTDTTGSGTIALRAVNSIAAPTLAASGAETLTLAANLYIAGAPIAGSNVTQTAQTAVMIDTGAAASIGLIVRGAAAQSAKLQDWRNSSNTVVGSVDNAGALAIGSTTITGSFSNNSTGGVIAEFINTSATQDLNLLKLYHNKTSANNDAMGLLFEGNNSSAVRTSFARMHTTITTNTASSENGVVIFSVIGNGTLSEIFRLRGGTNLGAVFNETAVANLDFRMEGGSDPNTFFLQGSSNNIGFGNITPAQKLHITNGHIRMDQVAVAGAPSVATGAAGVLTGAYLYMVTFVTATGETSAGTTSASVSPSSQQVALTAIPTSADATVTSRKIYRTTAGGATTSMKLVTTIADNTTTTYNDNIADGSLTTNMPFKNTTGGEIWVGTNRVMFADATFTGLGVGAGNGTAIGGSNATAIGASALNALTFGINNTAVGYNALALATTVNNSTAVGRQAGSALTTGANNTYIGSIAGQSNQTGANNTWIGYNAGTGVASNSNSNNTGVGLSAGASVTTGSNNVLFGYNAGNNLTSGASNLILGYNINAQSATNSNQMSIGNLLFSAGLDGTGTTLSTGNLGIGVVAPVTKLHVILTDAGTAAVVDVTTISHRSSGTPASSFGTGLVLSGDSSTNTERSMARIRANWRVATDASRKAQAIYSVFDNGAERDAITLDTDGANAYVSVGTAQQLTKFAISGSYSFGSWTTTGSLFSVNAGTQNDANGTGTIAFRTMSSFGIPTLTSTSSETLTLSANVYIAGAPVASTNVTQTKSAALVVDAGAAASIPLVLRGASSQSANYLEIQNSAGTVIFRVNSAGDIAVLSGTGGSSSLNSAAFNLNAGGGPGVVQNNTATAASPLLLKSGSNADVGSYVAIFAGGVEQLRVTNAALTITDAINVILGTTTGTKIGTATSQKLSLWNKTPIVQPTNGITAAAFVANTSGTVNDTATYGGYTIGQIAAALIAIGALA